jgi:predicted transcriptional regulator
MHENLTIRLGPEMRARLEAVAAREKRTVSFLVREAVEAALKPREAGYGKPVAAADAGGVGLVAERVAGGDVDRRGSAALGVVPVAGEPVGSSAPGGARAAAVSRRQHRWVSVAKDSPVKECEHCHVREGVWRKNGCQPEVCDG